MEQYYNIAELYGFSCQGEHDISIIKGYAATCKRTGMTDGQVCHRCGTILVQQEVIPITHTILEYNVDSNYSHSGTCDLCGQYVSSPHEFEIVTNICSQCGYKHENQSKKWENNMVMQFFAYATIGLTLNVIVILVIVRQRKRENV